MITILLSELNLEFNELYGPIPNAIGAPHSVPLTLPLLLLQSEEASIRGQLPVAAREFACLKSETFRNPPNHWYFSKVPKGPGRIKNTTTY